MVYLVGWKQGRWKMILFIYSHVSNMLIQCEMLKFSHQLVQKFLFILLEELTFSILHNYFSKIPHVVLYDDG